MSSALRHLASRALPRLAGRPILAARALTAARELPRALDAPMWWPDVGGSDRAVPFDDCFEPQPLAYDVPPERSGGSIVGSIMDISLDFDLPAPAAPQPRTPEDPEGPPPPLSTMPKRTYQPNRQKRRRTHGFLARMRTRHGRKVLERRRAKGRWKIVVT